jgi:transcriptional regulator with XRE-family HTH domain
VIEALRFEPVGVQPGLEPIDVAGNPNYRVDPRTDDLYQRLVDLRSDVKAQLAAADNNGADAKNAELDAQQKALKLCANATSYGIFVELNVAEQDKPHEVTCHGPNGNGFSAQVRNLEKPGPYFHPLLATLITGAARLMLAIAERLAEDDGIGWAFCDTDSMALARPEGMEEADFLERAERLREWFTPLNPYKRNEPIFQLEDANFIVEGAKTTDRLQPLYAFAVSAKRYALFNFDEQGNPVLRKVSAHGLGHLRPPYGDGQAPASIPEPAVLLSDLGAERWQHDLWHRVMEAALGDAPEQVQLDDLPGFEKPAVSRYAATTPNLLRWFKGYNRGKPYREQVRPFGFLLAYQSSLLTTGKASPKPVSTYDKDLEKAVADCFDRNTGEPVSPQFLKTYQEALAQYHLHPEAKFHNGGYLDRGVTGRRHIGATATEHIGKEANRWEEQFYLGLDLEAQTEYGSAPDDHERILEVVRLAGKKFGQRTLARAAGVSLSEVSAVLLRKRRPTPAMLTRLYRAVPQMEKEADEQAKHRREVLDAVRDQCQRTSLRLFAKRAKLDEANLARVLKGRRKPSQLMLAKLQAALAQAPKLAASLSWTW